MGDVSQKLNKLLETKEQIRQAIIDKGVEVGEDVVFADYSNKISAIESGNGDDFLALRTLNHTNYKNLFAWYQGESLNAFELNTWDTSNVTTMESMFSYCEVKDYDLSNWDFSKVTDTSGMFSYSDAVNIDLSSWTVNTGISSYYVGQMFIGCSNLETLDIRNLNITDCISNVSFTNAFYRCRVLRTLRLDNCPGDTINKIITSTNFPTGVITDSSGKEILDDEGNTIPRKIYCKQANAEGLTLPDGWEFVYVD